MARGILYYTKIETMLRHRLHHGLHRKLLSYCYYSSTNCISCCQFPWSNFIMSHPALSRQYLQWTSPASSNHDTPVTNPHPKKGSSGPGEQTWSRGTWHMTRGSGEFCHATDAAHSGSAVYLSSNCIKLCPLMLLN